MAGRARAPRAAAGGGASVLTVEPAQLPLQSAASLAELAGAGAGLWRYRAAIPVDAASGVRLSLGEGGTPLIEVADQALGGRDPALARVRVKLEFVSPTGSFKDRGAVVLLARARARGVRELIADSSGNAGSAIAAYAARAGLPCTVYVPASTSPGKQRQIRAYGATVELVLGDRTATAQRAAEAVQARAGEAFYASHVHDPYFLQGTKTFAFEVWEQLGGVPDALVIPAGNGTLLLGAAIGFAELRAAGLIERVPALIAVQSERCAPLAEAWAAEGEPGAAGGDSSAAGGEEGAATQPTVAEGIAIPHPARRAEMLAAVRASGGAVVAVPDAAIVAAQADLARRGLLVEPTAAVPWAATLLALAPERLGFGAALATTPLPWASLRTRLTGSVVVPLCGSGLKTGLLAPG